MQQALNNTLTSKLDKAPSVSDGKTPRQKCEGNILRANSNLKMAGIASSSIALVGGGVTALLASHSGQKNLQKAGALAAVFGMAGVAWAAIKA